MEKPSAVQETKKAMPNDPTTKELFVSTSPHIRQQDSVPKIMLWVVGALVPAFAASIFFFGWSALMLTAVGVSTAVATEWLIVRFLIKKPSTIGDFSAIVTGILLAFNLPPTTPWWMVAIGSAFAIGVAKFAFGGLGSNFINPALAGRAFLLASYPAAMTNFVPTRLGSIAGFDGVTGATPLAFFKDAVANGTLQSLNLKEALMPLLLGNVGGCIGETSVVALLLGALFLFYKRIIGLGIPLTYIGTVFLLYWLFNGTGNHFSMDALVVPVYQILGGGLMLGALFMATDMVTSPVTPKGQLYFGLGCGVLTFIIRKFGGYPEGVSYSILLMNLVVPHIDRYTRPKIYGEVQKRA